MIDILKKTDVWSVKIIIFLVKNILKNHVIVSFEFIINYKVVVKN